MKTNKVMKIALFLLAFGGMQAQNVDYSNMEKRFVKKELSAQDTVAFREVGEQKVQQLFDKSHFYSQNYSNTSNQVYAKQQIPNLFYVAPGDTLDVNELVLAIERLESKQTGQIELNTKPTPGISRHG